MKHNDNKASQVNNSSKPSKTVKKGVSKPKVSKAILEKQRKAKAFVKKDANSYSKLLQVSRLTAIDSMGLNKGLKSYLAIADKVLTKQQIEVLTFAKVKKHISTSKYKALPLFSLHQITLVCNEVLKANDNNVKRALRVEKQNKAIASK